MTENSLFIIGNGGHARSLRSLVVDLYPAYFHIGSDGDLTDELFLADYKPLGILLANGVGVKGISLLLRNRLFYKYKERGFHFENIVASSAILLSDLVSEGIQIFHNVYIGPNVKIGDNTIINTGAIVEHDSSIGESSFVGPGAVICGGVAIESNVFIGAGAIILPDTKIPTNTVIPAGSRFPVLEARNHKL